MDKFIDIVVACDPRGVIAYQQKIPWNIPEDKKLLEKIIWDQVVFMGRACYEDTPVRYFHHMTAYVLSKSQSKPHPDKPAYFFNDFDQLLKALKQLNKKVYCLGGQTIYSMTLQSSYVDVCHVSHIHQPYSGDRYFPLDLLKSNQFEIKQEYSEWTYVTYQY